MEKEIKGSVKYAIPTQNMCLDLEEMFGKVNAPKAYELNWTITTIYQEGTTVSVYHTKIRGVWVKIQSISQLPTYIGKGCWCKLSKEITINVWQRVYLCFLNWTQWRICNVVKTHINNLLPSLWTTYHLVSRDKQRWLIGHGMLLGSKWQGMLQNNHKKTSLTTSKQDI